MSTQKELLVELRIPLPTGLFEEAAAVAKAQYAVETFKETIDREIGEGHTLKVSTVNKRGPKTKTKAKANGAAKPTAATVEQPAATA